MSFYEFMQSFLGDDTPLGELVDWINQDSNFPREVKSHSEILSYFRTNPCPENISVPVIKRALSVFNQFTNVQ
ncbi:TPA: sterile alpha motif-like domain-containing protein [Staphylococcus aureus]|nr:sterile alpha motif-like domain-containing protein [Staphylococcus aureus]HDI0318026.1 sterile alpha motif-like domain-containing protein [Staphylococcus aureus]